MSSTEVNENKKSECYKFTDKKEKPLTKVIVRRLPPTIDLKTFLNQVSPLPNNNYVYLAKGDNSLGKNCFARVYINFVCAEDVYTFKERFDNYVFIDNKGHEYPAVVEYASFQKIPKKRNKSRIDPKCGSMELDPHYIEFLELINKPKEQEKKLEYSLQLTNTNKNDLTTPLLEYIKNKRAERLRFREGRREERKKKELKKERDTKKKLDDDKSPTKPVFTKSQYKDSSLESENNEHEIVETNVEKNDAAKGTKPIKYEKKYDEGKKEFRQKFKDKREYKDRDFKKYGDYRKEKSDKIDNKEEKPSFQKKIKKYSEKREERKMEAAKAEQKKEEAKKAEKERNKDKTKNQGEENIVENNKKDFDPKDMKRIRNKDRPALTIYRPGMLSKRKQTDGENENK